MSQSSMAAEDKWRELTTTAVLYCCVVQIGIAVMHIGRLYLASGWLSVLVAFQCVLLWFRLNYFSRYTCYTQTCPALFQLVSMCASCMTCPGSIHMCGALNLVAAAAAVQPGD